MTHCFPPGPRSRIPGKVFRALRAGPLAFLAQQAEIHGDLFSFSAFGQRYVVACHPELVRDVLLTQADAFWKGPALQNSRGILGDGLLTAEGNSHKQQRRLMTPAFHARQVESYAGHVTDCTGQLITQWQNLRADEPIDIRPHTMRLTLLIAGRSLFGALLEEQTERVRHAMETLLGNFNRAVVPWGKLLGKLPLPSTRRLNEARHHLHSLIQQIIRERREQLAGHPGEAPPADLLTTLIAATDPESKVRLTDRQLADQAITILTAGHETTANAMAFTLYLLAKYPAEQQRLRGQLAPLFQPPQPTLSGLEQVPLLRHVLSESMRLLPPVWTVGRQNQRPIQLGAYELPARCTVLVPQWVVHRDARWWPDPLAFKPDRWKNPSHPRYAYFPFSTGPRNCIGEAFAWLEMSLALALLIQCFSFSLPAGFPDPLPLTPSITLRPRGPLTLNVRALSGA